MKTSRTAQRGLAAALAACLAWALALALAAPALAVTELDYEPSVNPVADNVTRVEVSKLEKGSRDYVKGARLQIIRKDTGEVVAEWTSEGKAFTLERQLDVDVVYVLREVSAPEGYELAPDTEFVLRSVDFNTRGEVLTKHDDVDYSDQVGNGAEQCFVINLYDDAKVTQEREVHKQREVKKTLPFTGDATDMGVVYGLCAAGLACLALGIRTRRNAEA